MRLSTQLSSTSCPYCGELIELVIDPSLDEQEYVEDCSVCCRPIVVWVQVDGNGGSQVTARREDD